MGLELIQIIFRNRPCYAGVDGETGLLNIPFTQFMCWFTLGKTIRGGNTRGNHPTTLTLREYAYRLKRLFDFIWEWNTKADEEEKISWNTIQKKHLDHFYIKLNSGPVTRNGIRFVIKEFFDDFCPYMGYVHLMRGLSERVQSQAQHAAHARGRWGHTQGNGEKVSKTSGQEPVRESLTYKVASLEDIGFLLTKFDDPVYSHLSYFMFTTGLRIGGALQVPYPGTDKTNPYITSPELLLRDYDMSDFFPFSYVPKGHEDIGDRYECDVPVYAWNDIWETYRPLQIERLSLWRDRQAKAIITKGVKDRFPSTFWLDKKGREVNANRVWKVYRDAVSDIRKSGRPGFPQFVPHMLRHSYATWMVVCYAEAQHLSLNPSDKGSLEAIHQYLQEQLGHTQRETTIKYMRTALRVVKRKWLPKVMPRRLPDGRIVAGLSKDQLDTFKNFIDFDGFMKSLTRELSNDK